MTAKDKEDDLPNHPGEGWNRCEDPKFATDWTLDHNPIMPLDPNKFIMPVLPYGPNNQLRGFRETIILAIKLNRTVVMPPFYKHRSDPSPGEIRLVFSKFFIENWLFWFLIFVENDKSYPWRKIDEDELRKFITVASPGKSRPPSVDKSRSRTVLVPETIP